MRDLLTTFGELVGIAAIAVGCALIYVPAGVIAAGVGLIAVSYLSAADDPDGDRT